MNHNYAIGGKKYIRLGFYLKWKTQNKVVKMLKATKSTFAWKPKDVLGVDLVIITLKLNIEPFVKLIKQKKRKFAPKR